jgi:ketosteroid isomerase-like protein
MDNIVVMQSIWGPLERGVSADLQPFFDALADDVEFRWTIPAGTPINPELRGKQAVVDHLMKLAEIVEFRLFEKPLEYFGGGGRVVVLGQASFVIKRNGVTVRGSDYADVVDFRDGQITRFLVIQDLSAIVEAYRSHENIGQ